MLAAAKTPGSAAASGEDMMGLMVAANRRFAEFGDSVMVRGLGVQRATPV